jgi:hypothetical protein
LITDKASVEELVLRLKILEKYPKTSEGEGALVEALQTAETRLQATQFISGWIRNNKRCPMPCDVYQSLDSPGRVKSGIISLPPVPKGQDVPPPDYKCRLCEDTGWFMVTTDKEIFDMPGRYYKASKRCGHPPEHAGKNA